MRFVHDPYLTKARAAACLLGLLTISLLAGCGGGGGGSNGNSGGGTTTTGTNTGTPTPLTVSVTTPTGLTASLTEASGTVSVNGTLVYTLTLTNNTANTLPIRTAALPPALPATPAAGLVVRNSSGVITYEPVPGTPPITNATLLAGKALTETVMANGFTAAGTYSATATFGDDPTFGYAATVGPLTVNAQ